MFGQKKRQVEGFSGALLSSSRLAGSALRKACTVRLRWYQKSIYLSIYLYIYPPELLPLYKLSSVRSVRVVALSSIAHQNSLRPAVFLAEHVQPELGLLPLQSVGSSQAVSHTHGGASAFPAE